MPKHPNDIGVEPTEAQKAAKACIHCEHMMGSTKTGPRCIRTTGKSWNVVYGDTTNRPMNTCSQERSRLYELIQSWLWGVTTCGPAGRYWEPRKPRPISRPRR